jgi:hypothetical protein
MPRLVRRSIIIQTLPEAPYVFHWPPPLLHTLPRDDVYRAEIGGRSESLSSQSIIDIDETRASQAANPTEATMSRAKTGAIIAITLYPLESAPALCP